MTLPQGYAQPRLLPAATTQAVERDELDDLDDDSTSGDVGDFAPRPRWSERSFAGNTQYTIDNSDGVELIMGETEGQASVLYRQEYVNLQQTPTLRWEWKISNVYNGANERSRAGDDYPARVYVVVKTGTLPWQTRTINYVWSTREPVDANWRNPFSDKAIMVVLDSGPMGVGQWVSHARDIRADFKRYWQLDIEQIDGYAFMIDGDNTGSTGKAWLRDLRFVNE